MLQAMRVMVILCEWVSRCIWDILEENKSVVNRRGDDPVGFALRSSNLGTLAFGPPWFLRLGHRFQLPL
jgi:hypothetical protein